MSDIIKEDQIVALQIVFNIPEGVTKKQLDEWINYCTGYTGSIEGSNPLVDYEFNQIGETDEFHFNTKIQ